MADTPKIGVRAEQELVDAARQSAPELATLNVAHLLRVGLAVLAGYSVSDAVPMMQRRTGRKQPADGSVPIGSS